MKLKKYRLNKPEMQSLRMSFNNTRLRSNNWKRGMLIRKNWNLELKLTILIFRSRKSHMRVVRLTRSKLATEGTGTTELTNLRKASLCKGLAVILDNRRCQRENRQQAQIPLTPKIHQNSIWPGERPNCSWRIQSKANCKNSKLAMKCQKVGV